MKESRLIQITRRRQIGGTTYECLVGHLVARMEMRTRKPQIAAMRLSGKLSDKIVNTFSSEIPDCQTCGACCAFYTCVAVAETDSVPRSYYWKIGERGFSPVPIAKHQMRRDPATNDCVALEGEIGRAVRCGIYNRRPAACRDFEAGSDQCHAARRAFGLEPLLTEEQFVVAERRLTLREANERRRKGMGCVASIAVAQSFTKTSEVTPQATSYELVTRRDAA